MSRPPRVLPDTTGRRRIVVASAVDTLGVGLFLPLSLYYFTVSTQLSLTGIGTTTSAATLAALLTAPYAGALTDRLGPRNMAALSNIVVAVGYMSYLVVHDYVELFAAVFVVMAGDRLYFAAWPTLIADISDDNQRDAWYALIQTVGAGSLGTGALLSGILLAGEHAQQIDLLIVFNALTSVVAALLTLSLRVPRRPAAGGRAGGKNYAVVLRDRTFVRLLVGQALMAAAWILPGTFLPLYLVRSLGLPAWYAMVVFSFNYFLVFLFQLLVTNLFHGFRRTRTIALGACCFVVTTAVMAAAPLAGRTGAFALLLAAIAVYTVGEMLCVPAGNAAVAAHAPAEMRGMYMATFQLTGAIAFGAGPGLVGVLFARDPAWVLAAVALAVTLGGVAVVSSDRALVRTCGETAGGSHDV
ncbi:MFS transporter [Streptomyces sp. NPDC059627]